MMSPVTAPLPLPSQPPLHDLLRNALRSADAGATVLYRKLEAGLRAAVTAACGTLGREVRVELPDGSTELGVAESIEGLGRLVVAGRGGRVTVAAGDVTHLRHS